MKIQDFEKELKKIDDGFEIKTNPNFLDMAGVYWRGNYICGCPSGEIYDEIKPLYQNSAGYRHRTRLEVLAIIQNYLDRIKNEKGFFESEISFNDFLKKN
jgi:hypothetical protein